MLSLPTALIPILTSFSPLFTQPTWAHLQIMLMGAILCQGPRRISTVLKVMGLGQDKGFEKYHRVFNRAKWNSIAASKILLGLLIGVLPADYPLLIIVDETLERRKGKRIRAKGYYRDACRSSEAVNVNCFGLKWLCLMLIVPLPWCSRPWALPFMTLLAPSKEANQAKKRRHKTSIDWTISAVNLIARWLKRPWLLIGDGSFACLRLGHACHSRNVTLISRLRFDAALYEWPTLPIKGQLGRHRQKGQRVTALKQLATDNEQPWQIERIRWYGRQSQDVRLLSGIHLWYSSGAKPLPIRWVIVEHKGEVVALFSTDVALLPAKIAEYFVLRWSIEVTFEESRAHLGFETQRQWSDRAIARTTPVLLALFSLVSLFARELIKIKPLPIQSTAWYDKKGEATFSDILVFVRREIWATRYFNDSLKNQDPMKINDPLWETLLDQLSRAT
jgi:hypothetical protein